MSAAPENTDRELPTLRDVTLRFHDFARGGTWDARLPTLDVDTMIREVRRRGQLMSRGWDVDFDMETGSGVVTVGGFRAAGRITAMCSHCRERIATCLGEYESCTGDEEYACDECCGHGNEDGHCQRLNAEES